MASLEFERRHNLRQSWSSGTYLQYDLWVHYLNLIEMRCFYVRRMIRSGHNFARVTTVEIAELSWHVQICNLKHDTWIMINVNRIFTRFHISFSKRVPWRWAVVGNIFISENSDLEHNGWYHNSNQSRIYTCTDIATDYNNVTYALWRLKSTVITATRLFFQQLSQANNKENIKAPDGPL